MELFRIGYLPLTKANWTNDALEAARETAKKSLECLPGVQVVGGTRMIGSEESAMEELKLFEREKPDLVIAHFMTVSLGVIVPMFAQRLKTPVVLWSMKEPDPAGGRLQLRRSDVDPDVGQHAQRREERRRHPELLVELGLRRRDLRRHLYLHQPDRRRAP